MTPCHNPVKTATPVRPSGKSVLNVRDQPQKEGTLPSWPPCRESCAARPSTPRAPDCGPSVWAGRGWECGGDFTRCSANLEGGEENCAKQEAERRLGQMLFPKRRRAAATARCCEAAFSRWHQGWGNGTSRGTVTGFGRGARVRILTKANLGLRRVRLCQLGLGRCPPHTEQSVTPQDLHTRVLTGQRGARPSSSAGAPPEAATRKPRLPRVSGPGGSVPSRSWTPALPVPSELPPTRALRAPFCCPSP